MAELLKKKMRRAVKLRRIEIEQCLAAQGLSRGPRRVLVGENPAGPDTRFSRLRDALTKLGPVFCSFGLYLSSRVDLLPVGSCLELEGLADRAEATPFASIRETIQKNLGCFPEAAFIKFDPEPVESRLFFQSHQALLSGAGAVTVKVIHPELEERIDIDVRYLPLLKEAFAGLELTESQLDQAIDDFRDGLRRQMEFTHEARSLEAMGNESKDFMMLAAPTVHGQLCSPKVLTVERLPGVNVADLISSFDEQGRDKDLDRGSLATTLCMTWLRQALIGNALPVEPIASNVVVLPTHQIAFSGGHFAKLSSGAKSSLRNYLNSFLAEDHDKACESLLTQMDQGDHPISSEDLGRVLRQVVPFRDGGWSDGGNGDSLAEHLFVQWRLAGSKGLRPQPQLISFCRGFFTVAVVARRLSSSRDSLREGFETLRLMGAVAEFRQMIGVRDLGVSMDKYATMMIELPKKLDEVLTLAAEGTALVKARIGETVEGRRQKNSLATLISLLIALVALALIFDRFVTPGGAGNWAGRIGSVTFVVLGALLLRAASRLC